MKIYTNTNNGEYPRVLPDVIILSDGETVRTDSSTYTEEEIADAGWVEAPAEPEYNPRTHRLSWSYENLEWVVTEREAEEVNEMLEALWAGVRNERNSILTSTDYLVIKAYECGTELDSEWASYRQALRDITNQDDPANIVWPDKPE